MLIKRRALGERAAHTEFLRAFEIPPVNLDLLRTEERDAAIAATRELYDAIPGPFQILSVPIERSPSEHLDWLVSGPRGAAAIPDRIRGPVSRPCGQPRSPATAKPARPFGRSETAVARVAELVRRTGEEHGIRLRSVSDARARPGDVVCSPAKAPSTTSAPTSSKAPRRSRSSHLVGAGRRRSSPAGLRPCLR